MKRFIVLLAVLALSGCDQAQAQSIQGQMNQARIVAQQYITLSQNARAYLNNAQKPLPATPAAMAEARIIPSGMAGSNGIFHAGGGRVEFLAVPAGTGVISPPGQQTPNATDFPAVRPQQPPTPQAPIGHSLDSSSIETDGQRFVLNFYDVPSLACVASINSLAIDKSTMDRYGVQSVTINNAPINAPIATAVVQNLCGLKASIGVIFRK